MEEFGTEHKPQHERLLCPQNYWPGRVRRGLRVQEGRHGQDVRHEGEGEKPVSDSDWLWLFQCLDKKRIKMKQGETLALNERIMLSLVSTGHDCPFIVCMTYAFHTQDKLCFILDLMNGGDLHYHLSQVLVGVNTGGLFAQSWEGFIKLKT